jgi:hypothetical protein
MGKILCATRGGEQSIRTQEAAIRLAKDTRDELIFFIAYDVEFMQDADFALRSELVADEVEHMCVFLMLMAVERAAKHDVTARYIVREGAFAEMLVDVIRDEGITTVVVGRPGEHASRFALAHLEEMGEQIEADTGAAFRILPEVEQEQASV